MRRGNATVLYLVLIGSLAVPWVSRAVAEDLFPDKKLEAVVRKSVFEKRNNEEPLTEADVEKISTIEGKNAGVTNLAGLEKCRSLLLLDLEGNQIQDLTPLKELANLQSLTLSKNRIQDLTPLAELKRLQLLDLSDNQIEDLKPLAGLEKLRPLYLSNNKISDVTPLASLTQLWTLYLDGNQIQDLTPLAKLTGISSLDLRGNKVEGLQPLSEYTELKYLFLDDNQITDLGVLIDMARRDREGQQRFAPFCNIYLSGNPLSEEAKTKQLEELKTLVRQVTVEKQ